MSFGTLYLTADLNSGSIHVSKPISLTILVPHKQHHKCIIKVY